LETPPRSCRADSSRNRHAWPILKKAGTAARLSLSEGMRAMVRDEEVRFERLMFTKGLETTSPAER
jgi:hypothetical protein